MKEKLTVFAGHISRMIEYLSTALESNGLLSETMINNALFECENAVDFLEDFETMLSSSKVSFEINGRSYQKSSYTDILMILAYGCAMKQFKKVDWRNELSSETLNTLKNLVATEISKALEVAGWIVISKKKLARLLFFEMKTLNRRIKQGIIPAVILDKDLVVVEPEFLNKHKQADSLVK